MHIFGMDACRGAILAGALVMLAAPAQAQGTGEKTYKARCAACHGPDGAGATPVGKATKARDLCSEEVKKETDDEWKEIIVKGRNKMPAFNKKLTEVEIKDVIAYMRDLCKK